MKKFYKLLAIIFVSITFTGCITVLNIDTLNKKALEYMAKNDYDNAIARLVSINDLDPSYPEVHYNLGVAYIRKKEYPKALVELNKAVELKEDLTDAYYSLGVVNEELADQKIEELKKVKKETNKETLKQEIIKHVEDMFDSYEAYAELTTEDYEKEQIKGQFNFLEDKYKDYIILEGDAPAENTQEESPE